MVSATNWHWLSASPLLRPCRTKSNWCLVATHSPRPPTVAAECQTVIAAGRLSCNAPSETSSSAQSHRSLHAERGRRHQKRCKMFGPDRKAMRRRWPVPWNRGAGSACTGASGLSMRWWRCTWHFVHCRDTNGTEPVSHHLLKFRRSRSNVFKDNKCVSQMREVPAVLFFFSWLTQLRLRLHRMWKLCPLTCLWSSFVMGCFHRKRQRLVAATSATQIPTSPTSFADPVVPTSIVAALYLQWRSCELGTYLDSRCHWLSCFREFIGVFASLFLYNSIIKQLYIIFL